MSGEAANIFDYCSNKAARLIFSQSKTPAFNRLLHFRQLRHFTFCHLSLCHVVPNPKTPTNESIDVPHHFLVDSLAQVDHAWQPGIDFEPVFANMGLL